jgi:hypothetical protein
VICPSLAQRLNLDAPAAAEKGMSADLQWILADFTRAVGGRVPTDALVADYVRRYPQHEHDIVHFAVELTLEVVAYPGVGVWDHFGVIDERMPEG